MMAKKHKTRSITPKKHELAMCVSMVLCGLPLFAHAGFVTSDNISGSSGAMMSYTPNPKSTNTSGKFVTTNAITPANTITAPKPQQTAQSVIYQIATPTAQRQTEGVTQATPKNTVFVHSNDIAQPSKQEKENKPKTFVRSDNISQNHEAQSQKSTSLAKLSKHYQPKPMHEGQVARCEGVWVQPKQGKLSEQLGQDGASDTWYAQADYGYHDNKDYAELAGNVIVEQNGQQIIADKLTYHHSTGQMRATGQVQFSDDATQGGTGIIGVAGSLHYANQGAIATAHDVAFASTTMNAHGHAKQLEKTGANQYQMQEVMFSTCPPNERKWQLDASSIDIDHDTGRGVAKHSTLKVGGVSVFYLPYFNFPIDDRRTSGFLLPTAGISSDSVNVSTPYYFNLAPNYDATLTPTIFSDKNPMLLGEFRYLNRHIGSGVLRGSYLPNDRKYNNEDRKSLFYHHTWHSTRLPHLSAYANYRYVSDNRYLNDFDTLGVEGNPLNLPRNIGVTYYSDHVSADLRAETFQTLNGTNNDGSPILDKDKPYSRLPQLAINYRLPKLTGAYGFLNPFNIEGTHHSAYFKKSIKDNSESEKSGVRMYNQLSASHTISKTWGYLTPKLALTHLYASYDEDSLVGQKLTADEGTYSVFAPQMSVDAGLFFEKSGSPFGLYDDSLGGHQLIMPRLKYTHTPYKDQSQIPNFETAIGQISYDRLFADSWFLGYDRIQDLHAITPALHYRYIDNMGRTRFDGGIAEQIYLDDVRVGVNNSQQATDSSSGLAWRASAQPRDDFWVEAGGAFTPDYRLSSVVAQLRYQPSDRQLYNIGVIERKDNPATGQLALSAYTASAVFPINNRWRMLTQAQYDHKNDRLLDALIGVDYEDCCYGLSIYARRYYNDLNTKDGVNNAIMAEIRLNGITNGGKLSRLMSDKVMGYDMVNQAWQQAY